MSMRELSWTWSIGFFLALISFEVVGTQSVKAFELGDLRTFTSGVPTKKTSIDQAAPTPIRYADAIFTVHKVWKEKLNQNNFDSRFEKICTKKVSMPIYDLTVDVGNAQMVFDECNSTLDYLPRNATIPVVIKLGGIFYVNTKTNEQMFSPQAYIEFEPGTIPNAALYGQIQGKFEDVTIPLNEDDLASMETSMSGGKFYQNQRISVGVRLIDKP